MKYYNEFRRDVADLLESSLVQGMDNMKQHTDATSLLDHLLHSAYVTYVICKKLNLNAKEAARGALLHDFRTEKRNVHPIKLYFKHCDYCLEEANKYFDLSKMEQDIIQKHMWPATYKLPKYKESFVVTFADKYCATTELIGSFRKAKTTRIIQHFINKNDKAATPVAAVQ